MTCSSPRSSLCPIVFYLFLSIRFVDQTDRLQITQTLTSRELNTPACPIPSWYFVYFCIQVNLSTSQISISLVLYDPFACCVHVHVEKWIHSLAQSLSAESLSDVSSIPSDATAQGRKIQIQTTTRTVESCSTRKTFSIVLFRLWFAALLTSLLQIQHVVLLLSATGG